MTSTMSVLLPTEIGSGVCCKALLFYLVNANNDMVEAYHGAVGLPKARGMLNSFISTSHVRVYGIILHWMLMKSLLSQNYWDGETYITNNTAWYFRKQQPVTKIKNYAPMYATSSFCLFWVLIFRRPLWSCPRSEYLTPAVSLLDVDMCSIDLGNVAVSLMAYWFPLHVKSDSDVP